MGRVLQTCICTEKGVDAHAHHLPLSHPFLRGIHKAKSSGRFLLFGSLVARHQGLRNAQLSALLSRASISPYQFHVPALHMKTEYHVCVTC
jgi:hypothetical protein